MDRQFEGTDYKKFYQSVFGKIPKGFEIHHINFDRKDNSIQNLVALPKSIHRAYHKALYNYQHPATSFRIKTSGSVSVSGYNYTIIDLMEVLNELIRECNKWVDYRDYLRGFIPNIHNLNY